MADNITRPGNVSDQQWVKAQQLYNTAKNRGDRYPELTVAQAALETGWFKSPAGKYNYFGQKASSSQQGSLKSTTEVSGGSSYRTKAKFRDYNTLDEAVDDRIKKWGSKYKNANTVDEAISSIWRYNPKTRSGEGYATDDQYGQKLKSILGSMGVSTSDQGNLGGARFQGYDMPDYGVNTNVNLNTNTGEYTTAPEYQEPAKNTETQAAKEELLQKQNEKDFLAEIQASQQQQQEQQQDPGIDQSYYQMPGIALPEYQQIAAEQAQSQSQFQFQVGGKKVSDEQQWTIDYIQSPKYRERLKNSGYKDVDKEIQTRLSNVKNTGVSNLKKGLWENLKEFRLPPESGSQFNYKEVLIDYPSDLEYTNKTYPELTPPTRSEIVTHEIGHGETSYGGADKLRLNDYDKRNLEKRARNVGWINDHDKEADENKSDINAFRYQLKKQGIYDAGKEEFTKEHLKKAKETFTKGRLGRNYSDKSLIWLMNNIAQNDDVNEEEIAYAQNGMTFFPQVNTPFGAQNYQSQFLPQPTKAAPVKPKQVVPTTTAPVTRKPTNFKLDKNMLVETEAVRDNIPTRRDLGVYVTKLQPKQEQKWIQEQVAYSDNLQKQKDLQKQKEIDGLKKEISSKSVLEDSIENNEVSLDMNNYRTEKDVMKLQKMLTDKGYNLNPQGKFTNNGIDGKLGKVTREAMIKYNQHNSEPGYASIKEGTGFIGNCQEGQCSEYMQNEIFRNVQPNIKREDWNKKTGLYGNAWDIGGNIVKAGGSKVEPKAVKAGDVVTMFTGGRSDYQGEANAAGTGTTHTGLIDKVNPDGSYYILHNVHDKNRWTGEFEGREYRDLVKDGKIVSGGLKRGFEVRNAFRPDYKEVQLGEKKILRNDLNLTIDPKKSSLLSSKEYDNSFTSANAKTKLEKNFIKPLNDTRNKSVIAKVFSLGDDEYQSLAKVTLGILGQETSFGTNAKYTTGTKQLGAGLAKLVGYKPDEVSKGAGRLKYETNFGADDLTELGITQDNFDDEDKAPLTTMYKLATDYKNFLKKGYNKKDAMYRAVTVYNVSLNHVSQGKKMEDWAKNYDVDYTNKVLNYSSMFDVKDGKKSYKTATDELLLHPNVYKWREKLKKENKL
jgi:hypothetical protein